MNLLIKVVLVIRSRHLVETNRELFATGFIVKLYSRIADRQQLADERLLPVARAMRPHFHALALDRREMLQLAQRPVYPGRRDFQRVLPFYGVVHVEQITERRAQLLEVAERDSTARLIDQQAQDRGARALAKIHRDQFITLAFDVRLEKREHLLGGRMKHQGRHLFATPIKKWARAHSREQHTTAANLSARRESWRRVIMGTGAFDFSPDSFDAR